MALISENVISLLQYRIQQEEYSVRVYKAMAVWLEFKGYFGAAKLFQKYSDEEFEHAQWVYDYLITLNIVPKVQELSKPKCDFTGLPNVVAVAYDHELSVTNQCKKLASESLAEGDHLTYKLALKFVKEQVDELAKLQNWLDRMNAFGTDEVALRMLDNEMGG